MGLLDIFRRKEPTETRAAAMGYTADLIAARHEWITGASGIAELTATVQSSVSLWEGAMTLADVNGTNLLTRRILALFARHMALRGEAVFLIRGDKLLPVTDWEVGTRNGRPRAYRVTVSEIGGGASETVLAAEVLHVVTGSNAAAPWAGTAPLTRANLTAKLLQEIETALAEVYKEAPIGSQIVPFPEAAAEDMAALGRGFRGKRGGVLMRESVHVAAAGGPVPGQDWKAQSVTPDIQPAMPMEGLKAARASILSAFGVLPSLFDTTAQGPLVREAQRHLAQWQLQPLAALLAEEASEKLGGEVQLDVMRPLQAFDAGGRARALSAIVQTLALAKESGVDPSEALKLVDWE